MNGSAFVRCLLTLGWLVVPVFGIIDSNSNGISDDWERQWNAGNLLDPSANLQADEDSDGWNVLQEAAAGTSPHSAQPPTGYVRPVTAYVRATYYDPDQNGVPDVLTPASYTLTFPALAGKKYRILMSADLSANSWVEVDQFVGEGTEVTRVIALTQANGSIHKRLFFRLAIEDDPMMDSDEDGLPDSWELLHFGNFLQNGVEDYDGDGLTNLQEYQLGSGPKLYDTDGDGIADGLDLNSLVRDYTETAISGTARILTPSRP